MRSLVESWRAEPAHFRRALFLILATGIVVRLVPINDGVRRDERVTLTEFVQQPWPVTVSAYPEPNNHIFYTVLAKVSTTLFGDSLWALRLPALIAGVLIIPAAYVVVTLLYGGPPALIAAALVAISPELVNFSPNARGYSLVTLAFLLLVWLGVRLRERDTPARWAWFVVIATLGMWTIPVMLLPLGTVATWLAMGWLIKKQYAPARRLGAALGVAAVTTTLLYMPVALREGVGAITRNEYVVPTTWPAFASDMAANTTEMFSYWTLGWPVALSVLVGCCVIAGLIVHSRAANERFGIPHAAVVWCGLFLIAQHRAPPGRVWQWLIPIAAGLAATGVLRLIMRLRRELLSREVAVLASCLAIVGGVASLTFTY